MAASKSRTPEQELARRELARRRLLQFTRLTHPRYKAGWVHEDICRRLERFSADVVAERSPRLMLLMPPRHGKSELASIRFPAWHLGHHPEHEIINVGYNLDLPMIFSRKVREIMRDSDYAAMFPNTVLDPDSQGATAWKTVAGGGFTPAGVGGGITGKGAHILVIDDPIRNQEDADSILIRDSLELWFQSTAMTRLAPGGGILVIECMTGDTPVLRPDGSETRLDALRPGDAIATYEDGRLSATTVRAHRCSGRDSLLRITTSSGKIVRSNGRHPFLVSINGELKWIRARSLTTDHTIVAVRDSGVSGRGQPALLRGATSQQSAGACVPATTTNRNGLMGIGHRLVTPARTFLRSLSTATASLLKTMIGCSNSRVGNAQSVPSPQTLSGAQSTGGVGLVSTTATQPEKSVRSYVTAATSQSDILELSELRSLPLNTSEFILDRVVSVELAGEEEVFDIQVERTENFIANSLISHNTFWNDDDLAGRLQALARRDPEGDQYEIVRYPALAEKYEYRAISDMKMRYEEKLDEVTSPDWELLRSPGDCLHEARYNAKALNRIKANSFPRIWSALYQQNPVPDEGMYFKKEYFRYQPFNPEPRDCYIYTAWDWAVGLKTHNDWTVGATVMQDSSDNLYILDICRFKGDSFTIAEAVVDVAARWGSVYGCPYTLGFEDGQIWRAIEPLVTKRFRERHVYPVHDILKPLTDKMARARPLQGRMQQGRVYFPTEAPWLKDAEQELLRFPAGKHDDVVDALSWVAQMVMRKDPPRRVEAPPPPSWRDSIAQVTSGNESHMAA